MSDGSEAVPGRLFKTTIVIWSAFPGEDLELQQLAREACSGGAYCSRYGTELIVEPKGDPAWDGNDFFRASTD